MSVSGPSRRALVIVGGGPAGLATALFFAHAAPALAERVVVLERERYPREKFCAGAIGARGDQVLGSIGVTVDVPSVWVRGVAFRAMGRTLTVRDGIVGRVVRRIEFDHALAEEVRRRGVQVIEGTRVTGLRQSARDVCVETSGGTFSACAVVGADGVQSVVRRSLGLAATRFVAQALEVDTETLDDDPPRDVLLFDASRRSLPGYYWDFPTLVEGRPMTCRGVYFLRSATAPGVDVQALLEDELSSRGLRLSSYTKKRYAERGFEPHAPVSRHRVVLVGEAAGIDPITGEGIAQALHYGATAGRYLARKLAGADDAALEDWPREIRRNHVGRDLLVRSLGVGLFYGPRRPTIERFLLDTPDFVRVGLQHFAGKRWSRGAIARAAAGAVAHTVRSTFEFGGGRARGVPASQE